MSSFLQHHSQYERSYVEEVCASEQTLQTYARQPHESPQSPQRVQTQSICHWLWRVFICTQSLEWSSWRAQTLIWPLPFNLKCMLNINNIYLNTSNLSYVTNFHCCKAASKKTFSNETYDMKRRKWYKTV